jgi:hypothetical protein
MLVALAISHLLMPAALTLQDYHHLCLWLVRNINKNPINMSFSLVETGIPGGKPLQAKLRADYFSLSLFLYLQCLKKELKKRRRAGKSKCLNKLESKNKMSNGTESTINRAIDGSAYPG